MLCAGSQGGALKIWDLEAARIVRTLTGHKAAIRCLDHHPYGDFLVSGSLDTHIKVIKASLHKLFSYATLQLIIHKKIRLAYTLFYN